MWLVFLTLLFLLLFPGIPVFAQSAPSSVCSDSKTPGGVWQDGCIIKSCESGALEESLAEECVQLIEKHVEEILVEKLAEKGIECSTEIETSVAEAERDFLFIGPGVPSQGVSEVLHLPSFTEANCTPPTFPYGEYNYYDYVGNLTPDGPLLCGGSYNGEKQSSCHLLTRSGDWEEVQGMKMKRVGGSAVEIGGGWWVTGGYSPGGDQASTELWDGKTWQPHQDLPETMSHHCVVKINTTTVLFIPAALNGGNTGAFFYSPATGFVQTEAPRPRTLYACGLHKDYVVIAGGNGGAGYAYTSSEFFSLETLTWHVGPSVEHEWKNNIYKGNWQREKQMYNFAGDIFNWKGRTFWIGEINIWELLGDFGSWQWTKVKEMKTRRSKFETFLMTAQECSGWK